MSILIRIAERALNRPLLLHPDKVPLILGVLSGRIPVDQAAMEGLRAVAEARIDALPDAARAVMRGPHAPDASRFVGSSVDTDPATGATNCLPYRRTSDGVAVISVLGSLVNRGAWLGSYSGETSYEGLKFQVAHAAQDRRTKAILLDIESPGGEAVGAFEVADAVRTAAAEKPVTAVVNGMAASAAYAIASAARRIVTTSTGVSGSIGVVLLHGDFSRKLDKEGITPTLIFAGAHKVDANPFEPLSDAVRADLQAEVNHFYDLFVETVAAGRRGVSPKAIRATEARTFIGAEAVAVGLADDVGTFESALADLTRGAGRLSTSIPKGTSMDNTKGAPQADAGTDNATTSAPAPAPVEAAPAPPAPDAAAAEQNRIRAILTGEAAKGRETLAQHLAFNTRMSPDEAKGVLGAAPKAEPAPAAPAALQRAGQSAIGLVVAEVKGNPVRRAAKIDLNAIYAKRAQVTSPAAY